MMEDVNTGIGWVLSRIGHYGGDPKRVYLVGQSCGAQLSMMCLVTQVQKCIILIVLGEIRRFGCDPAIRTQHAGVCCDFGLHILGIFKDYFAAGLEKERAKS